MARQFYPNHKDGFQPFVMDEESRGLWAELEALQAMPRGEPIKLRLGKPRLEEETGIMGVPRYWLSFPVRFDTDDGLPPEGFLDRFRQTWQKGQTEEDD